MQQMKWQLVPIEPTPVMLERGSNAQEYAHDDIYPNEAGNVYRAMLAAAPEPPHLSMTKEEAATFQHWRGMDGAIAFHLIERHAEGWGDTARMMEAWLAANVALSNP